MILLFKYFNDHNVFVQIKFICIIYFNFHLSNVMLAMPVCHKLVIKLRLIFAEKLLLPYPTVSCKKIWYL